VAAGMMEAKKGFRRLKVYRQLPRLKAALAEHANRFAKGPAIAAKSKAV
jgi:hypothetical protein